MDQSVHNGIYLNVLGQSVFMESEWKLYLNRNKKSEAYAHLVFECKKRFPDANRDFVVEKIQSLRGSFRKELKKVNASKRSGASTDAVHIPSLWY